MAVVSLCFDIHSFENHDDRHEQTGDVFPCEAVIGRHRLFAVDVWGTLWTLDNRQVCWLVA